MASLSQETFKIYTKPKLSLRAFARICSTNRVGSERPRGVFRRHQTQSSAPDSPNSTPSHLQPRCTHTLDERLEARVGVEVHEQIWVAQKRVWTGVVELNCDAHNSDGIIGGAHRRVNSGKVDLIIQISRIQPNRLAIRTDRFMALALHHPRGCDIVVTAGIRRWTATVGVKRIASRKA